MSEPADTPQRKFAVALEYGGEGAPRVTAKGSGHIAQQILSTAQAHNIPIQQDSELVELLSQVALDEEIPSVLYEAVAQVLIFAYEISEKPIPSATSSPPQPPAKHQQTTPL